MADSSSLTKKQAAQEQLDTAILFFFNEGSRCAVHALSAASLTLSQDVLRGRNRTFTLDLEKYLRTGKEAEWRKIVNRQANFLKHADRDPADVLHFNEEQTKFFILQALDAYHTLHNEISYSMKIYQIWYAQTYPGFFQGLGWSELKDHLRHEGASSEDFTTETCGDLLMLDESMSNRGFGARCKKLFGHEETASDA